MIIPIYVKRTSSAAGGASASSARWSWVLSRVLLAERRASLNAMPRRVGGSVGSMAKGPPAAKKLAQLRAREEERKVRLHAEVDAWFRQFDFNQDGKLQRDELAHLLKHLEPDRPPTEEVIDFLMEKATAIETYSMTIAGDKNGSVSWHDARKTVETYHDYCKDQRYLDAIFKRFDADDSGFLDLDELPLLLQAIAPEGCQVDRVDAEYVLKQCDENGDGVISRDEVMPMLARWSKIAITKANGRNSQGGMFEQKMESFSAMSRRILFKGQAKDATKAKWRMGAAGAALKDTTPTPADGRGPPRKQGTFLVRVVAAAKATDEAAEAEAAATSLEEDTYVREEGSQSTLGGGASTPDSFGKGGGSSRNLGSKQPTKPLTTQPPTPSSSSFCVVL